MTAGWRFRHGSSLIRPWMSAACPEIENAAVLIGERRRISLYGW
jgi:hypothetical protein